jgi:Ca2+:H+ antiporter
MMDAPVQNINIKQTDVLAKGWGFYWKRSLSALFFENWLNLLLLCTPPAMLSHYLDWGQGLTFTLSLLAIAPFAERLSFVTEQLALHTSETLGGLLNATFGNVTELIVSLFALYIDNLRIVQVSLLGSILSNLLLVLGCAFFAGGVRFKQQKFNKTSCAVSAGLLLLGVTAVLFPTILTATHEEQTDGSALTISRCVSLLLFAMYLCYLYFQLQTHTHLYDEGDDDDDDDDDDDEEEAVLGIWGAIFWLAVITVFISLLSEYMVFALEGAAVDWGVPDLFLGTIIIPIVGNAAEHAAAIIFSVKNKMELALGIAVGSAVQIALLVIPVMVLTAWVVDKPLTLDFHPFEAVSMLMTTLLVGFIIQNGESNWLQGVMLVIAYCAVAAGFFVHTDPVEPSSPLSAPP